MTDTKIIKKKYDRNAKYYDALEKGMEINIYSSWRKKYFSPLTGKILEVGIGTGNNIDYINNEARFTGIDFSERMLRKARKKLTASGKKNITLELMDIEEMDFEDNSFDYVITASVFCSVPHPVKGLKEIKRVLKPAGKLIMIEHVLSDLPLIAFFENLFNPLVRFITGVNINRDTKQNIIDAGLKINEEKNLALADVFRLFEASS